MDKFTITRSLHVLGLKPGADARQIREAFRKLARAHHPDIAGARGAKKFEQITEAYAILKNIPEMEVKNEPEIKNPPPRESFFARWRRERNERANAAEGAKRESERARAEKIETIIGGASKKISSIIEKTEKEKRTRETEAIRLRLLSERPEVRNIALKKNPAR